MIHFICRLPPEILVCISDHLTISEKYNFAKTCKYIYESIWKWIDTSLLYDKIFYICHLNYYCNLILTQSWINFPFVFTCNKSSHFTNEDSFRPMDGDPTLFKITLSFGLMDNSFQIKIKTDKKVCLNNELHDLTKLGFQISEENLYHNVFYLSKFLQNTNCDRNGYRPSIKYLHDMIQQIIHAFCVSVKRNESLYNIYLLPFIYYMHPPESWQEKMKRTIELLSDVRNEKVFLAQAKNFKHEFIGYTEYTIETKGNTDKYNEIRKTNILLHETAFHELNAFVKDFSNDSKARDKMSQYLLNEI
jgi:hypothetical protein